MRKNLLFLIIPMLVIAWSCKKKSESPANKPLLMTVNVTGRYFNPLFGGVIFISDMQGKVLADTFCLADGVYHFYGQSGASVPSFLEVSTVRSEPAWHSFNISIETYNYISPSEWTLLGSRADTVGNINPVFKNIPAHNDAFLVSSSGYSNLTSILGNIPIQLYKSPDDIYIGIPTSAGLRYKWFYNAVSNAKDTFDLSNSLFAEKKTIAFPSLIQYYECRLQGFTDGNFNSPIPCMVDEILGNGIAVNSFDAYYPPSRFQGFHTDIMALEDYSSNKSWFYHVDGPIPTAFRKIAASLVSYSATNTGMQLLASGDMDAVSGTWQFSSTYKGHIEWTVFGPDTTATMRLPQIPPSLSNMFPWISRDSLRFMNAGLIDLAECQGYSQMISRLYGPANPSSFIRQETSILKVSASGK